MSGDAEAEYFNEMREGGRPRLPSKRVCGFDYDWAKCAVITNSIYGLLVLVGLGITLANADELADAADDDRVTVDALMWTAAALAAFSLVVVGLGIVGAMNYHRCMVLTCAVFFLIEVVGACVRRDWHAAIRAGIFLMPNVVLSHYLQ